MCWRPWSRQEGLVGFKDLFRRCGGEESLRGQVIYGITMRTVMIGYWWINLVPAQGSAEDSALGSFSGHSLGTNSTGAKSCLCKPCIHGTVVSAGDYLGSVVSILVVYRTMLNWYSRSVIFRGQTPSVGHGSNCFHTRNQDRRTTAICIIK